MSKLDEQRKMAQLALADKRKRLSTPFADAEKTAKARDVPPPKPVHKIKAGLEEAIAVSRGEMEPAKVTVMKIGRPLAKDASKALTKTRPWLDAGMSRATWYRAQHDAREEDRRRKKEQK